MKIRSFMNKFVLIAGLLLASQGFAALDCATGTGWGDFLTQAATKDTDSYYVIDTPEKLAWVACKVTNKALSSEKFKLTKSLDMQGKLFIPIGSGTGEETAFKGTFDGQNFTISNLYVNTSEINSDVSGITGKSKNGVTAYAQNIGLFGILSNNATVKNLILKEVQIYAAASSGTTGLGSDKPISVGSLVGWVGATDKTVVKIENIVASGSIETSGATNRVGGIAGNVKHVTISNCVSSVSVTASGANTNVGGVVGAIRNDGNVTLTSCVYSGDHLYTVDGSIGAVAGSYENSKGTLTTENLYYSDDFCQEFENPDVCPGIGKLPDGKTFNADLIDNLNSEDVVCALNGGTWNEGVCTGDTSEVWSVGQSSLSMNGSDGYKITFNANGGAFASGAKTSKILSKNATITADEIGVPTREGKKFAGWAVTADADTSSDLGIAHSAVTIYAVWYDFYDVTFKTDSEGDFSDATFPDGSKIKKISVAKHGVVSVDGFSVPTVYEIGTGANKVKYYFTGWAYEPKSFGKDDEIGENDTLHLSSIKVTAPVVLYAVWTKAPTFSVTFDASLHGKTDVHFVRMVTEGETVSRPDTVITDDGYKVVGWCEVENCTEENEYSFADSLKGNLVLHARWEMESYSIDYELDGGINAEDNPSAYNVNSDDIVFAAPTKEGASFDGWFYDQEFTNPATQIGKGSTGNKKVYAKWTLATYTIQYLSGNVISATVNGVTKNYGDTITLREAPPQFAVGGCTFDGWSKVDYGQEGYGVDYEFGAKYADNADLKLFPHWTSCGTYTITYELYGVEATNRNSSTYTGPEKVKLENAFVSGNPVKMDDWYLDPNFKTSVRYLQGINKNTTLYAKWYNVITFQPGTKLKNFNKDAGKVEKQKNLNNAYTLGIPNNKYAIANYTLDGWSTTDGGEKVYELGAQYTTNENLTLYPHWVESRDSVQYGAVKIYTYASDGRKEAVIDGAYTGADTIKIASDVYVNSVEFTRTFTPNTMSTVMLPFSIDTANVEGGAFYRFKRVEVNEETGAWKVFVGKIKTEQLGANTPYMVLPSATQLTFNGSVTFNTTTAPLENPYGLEEGSSWEYKGVYAHTEFNDVVEDGPMYAFAGQAKDGVKVGQFTEIGANVRSYPMQAYLVNHQGNGLSKSASGFGHSLALPNFVDVEIEDENGLVVQTGTLNTVTGEVRMDRWFDLKGRKLNAKPTIQGTYYKNGKKVIIK